MTKNKQKFNEEIDDVAFNSFSGRACATSDVLQAVRPFGVRQSLLGETTASPTKKRTVSSGRVTLLRSAVAPRFARYCPGKPPRARCPPL